MKQMWQKLIAWLEALSVRERLILFVSAVLCCAALFDVLWLSPAQTAYKQLTARLDKQNLELQRMREQVKQSAKSDQVARPVQDELQSLAQQLDQTNAEIRSLLPPPEVSPMVQTLAQLLRRHPGLSLVSSTVLAPDVAGPGNAKSSGLPPGLTRQGVAVVVAGAYSDLTRFVSTLEHDLPHVRWGQMQLKSEAGKPELTLQLFVLTEVLP